MSPSATRLSDLLSHAARRLRLCWGVVCQWQIFDQQQVGMGKAEVPTPEHYGAGTPDPEATAMPVSKDRLKAWGIISNIH